MEERVLPAYAHLGVRGGPAVLTRGVRGSRGLLAVGAYYGLLCSWSPESRLPLSRVLEREDEGLHRAICRR